MPEISEYEGIARGRSRLELGPLTPARVWRTRRADRPGEAYYLVVFGEPQAAIGVAAVDITSGEVMIWATLPGTGPHLTIDSETAVQRAGIPTETHAELVWKSCRGSHSPLYPLWEISAEKTMVYVDQQGVVWQSLESFGRGG
jgi:hypothetical protein